VDGETWRHYGERLEDNLHELSARLKRGAYRAKPVRRVPRPTGGSGRSGVTTLEDKVVQRATVAVVVGHNRYYGVPLNYPALSLFRCRVAGLWHRALSRRSHKGRVRWDRMRRLIKRWLPPVRIYHPYPARPTGVTT